MGLWGLLEFQDIGSETPRIPSKLVPDPLVPRFLGGHEARLRDLPQPEGHHQEEVWSLDGAFGIGALSVWAGIGNECKTSTSK